MGFCSTFFDPVSFQGTFLKSFLYFSYVNSSTAGGILDKAVEAEELVHRDFLRLVIFFHFSQLSLIVCSTVQCCWFVSYNYS